MSMQTSFGEVMPSELLVRYQFTDCVRAGIIEQGLSEEDVLADFETSRREREG